MSEASQGLHSNGHISRSPTPEGSGGDSTISAGKSSARTTSTAPLTRSGKAGGIYSTYDGTSRSRTSYGSSSKPEGSLDQAYRAGMPIGLLAAMGTPYAKKPLYRSTKCKVLCLAILPITVVVVVLITVFPVLKAIAKHALHTSVLHVYASNLTQLTNESFALTLDGEAKKTGIFPAHINFGQPVSVFWVNPDNMQEVQLGSFPLAYLGAAAGHGRIHQETFFTITDTAAFGRFSAFLITQESFTWRLRSSNVQAKAFSFLATSSLDFVKDLTLPAMANFTNVAIADFQLPGDDPAGGITLDVVTTLTNPSAFGVEIGTLVVDLYYDGLYLGPAQTSTSVNLTSGFNSFPLTGRLLSYAGNQTALAQLGVLFTNYVNGDSTLVTAVGRSATLPNGEQISWLSEGIRALQLIVPLKSPTGPLNPIKDIQIQTFSLTFPGTPDSYQPTAASNNLMAGIGLPFGFSLNISAVAAAITIVQNDTSIAQVQGVTGAATTILTSVNAGFTTGNLALTLPPSPLVVPDTYEGHLIYSQFQKDFTATNGSAFYLNGTTTATTSTPIGEIILNPVNFYVPAGLIGLQLLQTAPTLILSVDVTGGTPDYIELNILVGLTNPSNLLLDVGDVTFQLFRNGEFLGRTILPALSLSIGYQTHTSVGQFEANNNPTALDTLNRFTQGLDSQLSIGGYNGSSPYDSLQQAFMALQLNATLGGLQTQLLNYAALTVLPTTNFADNIADTTVSLQNPFTSVLDITNIQSNITSRGLYLGSIVTDTNFVAAGKAATVSPSLPFGLNLYPPDIFSLLRELVLEAGLNPDYLDGIVQLGGYQYVPTTGAGTRKVKRSLDDEDDESLWSTFGADGLNDLLSAPGKSAAVPGGLTKEELSSPDYADHQVRFQKRDNLYTGFDLPTYVDTAFKQLTVNVALVSVVSIGQFTTDLTYSQNDVPVITDQTLNLLLPVLAQPIVQKIVDGSVLAVDTVTITDPLLNSFGTGLTGSITQSGPFDAVISFPQGLTVAWNGAPLGQIAMPDVSLVGDVGATLNLQAAFSVADVGHLTDFTSYLLTEKSFTWEIYGQDLAVAALGITVPGISISKTVVLAGMDSFIGDVIINSFDLPANDPAGGITLTLQTTLTNPASVGVQLSTIVFENTFGQTDIGPAASTAAFILPPKGSLQLPLAGRLIPQTTQQGLDDVSTIFNGFVHGVPAQLLVHGVTAGPDGVTWLNDGIKALEIPVTLPAAASLQIINSITLNQLTLLFTEATAWSPSFSTSNTVAAFQLPFAFPLDITAASTNIISQDAGTDFALITVPQIPTTTDVTARLLTLAFQNVPFAVDPNYSGQHATFSQFLTDTTDNVNKSFVLHGSASTVASTAVGNLNINEIAFQVTTEIAGLQGLNAQQTTVSDLDVFHGYPDYLQINVNAHIFNPSEITIGTGDVAFGLTFENTAIGTANIANLVLVPDQNVVATAVHYQPEGDAAVAVGQQLLENYVQAVPSDTIIVGSASTTPIESLQQALGTIRLNTVIPPLMQNLITQANLVFPLDIVQTGIAQATFNLDNPFTAAINLNAVTAVAIYPLTSPNLNLGNITQTNLNPEITATGHTQITSRTLPFNFNLDPKTIIMLLIAQAAKNNVDLGPLVDQFNYVLGLASTASQVTTEVDQAASTCVSGAQFDVFGAILASLKNLDVNLQIQSTVHLDDYGTDLNFNQFNIPTITDSTALYLIGAVGKTIVQHLVDQSTLTVAYADVYDVTNDGFTTTLHGTLAGTGPFDASVSFPDGLLIDYNGNTIASIALPDLCAAAVTSIPNLVTVGTLTILNQDTFTGFATDILHNPSFEWYLHTTTLRVTALGTIFSNVNFGKTITLAAFNNLPGVAITFSNFPGDAPNGEGINIDTQTTIPSPAQLGIDLGTANFIASYNGVVVGPIHNTGDLVLAHQATTPAELVGYIQVQRTQADLTTIGQLFGAYLKGQDSTLTVTGDSVVSTAQPNSPVGWLTTAFKTLTLSVVLPGQIFTIIKSIQLLDLEVSIMNQAEAYAVDTSNMQTDAVYANPFTFSLQALSTAVQIAIAYQGAATATLDLPSRDVTAGTSTGQNEPLVLSFMNETLNAVTQGAFNNFFRDVTDTTGVTFDLSGFADVVAKTAIGNVPIPQIPFGSSTQFPTVAAVTSSLVGINSFGGTATIPNTPITIGTGNTDFSTDPGTGYIRITIDPVTLSNPSNISVFTNQVALPVLYTGVATGRAIINPLDLFPGTNNLVSEFHFTATDAAALVLITKYLTNIPGPTGERIPITIQGNTAASPYGSLQEALAGVTLTSEFPGIGARLVDEITVFVNLVTVVCKSMATFSFSVNNPLQAPLSIQAIQGTALQPGPYQDGVQNGGEVPYALFDYSFENNGGAFIVAAGTADGSTVTGPSPVVPASLPQSLLVNAQLLNNANNIPGSTMPGLDVTLSIRTQVLDGSAPAAAGFQLVDLIYAEVIIPYNVVFVADDGTAENGSGTNTPTGSPIVAPDLGETDLFNFVLGALAPGLVGCLASGLGFFVPIDSAGLFGGLTDTLLGYLNTLGVPSEFDQFVTGVADATVTPINIAGGPDYTSYPFPSIISSLYSQCSKAGSAPCAASLASANGGANAAEAASAQAIRASGLAVASAISAATAAVASSLAAAASAATAAASTAVADATSVVGQVTAAVLPSSSSATSAATSTSTTTTAALLPTTAPALGRRAISEHLFVQGQDGRTGVEVTVEEALEIARRRAEQLGDNIPVDYARRALAYGL
ncbi:uncharacterized protein L969DRAFT_18838 [Mixia osmundae IAM 14324]|nr:uncharacterized protein L969DRAFT_18838 [Mixia osmundae IAM 14324]KEI38050.1 hypothetical protein L969DRAFT_18838 [Mixia osmundae IAM 14324]